MAAASLPTITGATRANLRLFKLPRTQSEMVRLGPAGPFDTADSMAGPSSERPFVGRALRIAALIAQFKGVSEAQLTARDRAIAEMGLFRQGAVHRAIFKSLADQFGVGRSSEPNQKSSISSGRPRRIMSAPLAAYPSLPTAVVNVECADDEDVEWVWTATGLGSFVSGYRVVPRVFPSSGASGLPPVSWTPA
jgi:hypothetical protein